VAYSVGNARPLRAERLEIGRIGSYRDGALVWLRAVDRVTAKTDALAGKSICNDFGTFYAPNISIGCRSGIGGWSV
jgi:hypothetical protein